MSRGNPEWDNRTQRVTIDEHWYGHLLLAQDAAGMLVDAVTWDDIDLAKQTARLAIGGKCCDESHDDSG